MDKEDASKYLGLVEIKCPYKCSKEHIRSGADWRKFLRYLDASNKLIPTHDYYHQIQGQLCATNLDWCDFVVWCPSAFLVQRINLDPVWRSTTLFSLHSIYQWNIMREEDRANRNLVWPPVGAEEVDLEKLFTHCAIEKDIREVFVYCLAVHLGRWINSMAYSTGNLGGKLQARTWFSQKELLLSLFPPLFSLSMGDRKSIFATSSRGDQNPELQVGNSRWNLGRCQTPID